MQVSDQPKWIDIEKKTSCAVGRLKNMVQNISLPDGESNPGRGGESAES